MAVGNQTTCATCTDIRVLSWPALWHTLRFVCHALKKTEHHFLLLPVMRGARMLASALVLAAISASVLAQCPTTAWFHSATTNSCYRNEASVASQILAADGCIALGGQLLRIDSVEEAATVIEATLGTLNAQFYVAAFRNPVQTPYRWTATQALYSSGIPVPNISDFWTPLPGLTSRCARVDYRSSSTTTRTKMSVSS